MGEETCGPSEAGRDGGGCAAHLEEPALDECGEPADEPEPCPESGTIVRDMDATRDSRRASLSATACIECGHRRERGRGRGWKW